MHKNLDFYTVAAPLALVVGFLWVYLAMTVFRMPGWRAMVGMAAYYAAGMLAVVSAVAGILLGLIHQNLTLAFSRPAETTEQ